MTDDEVVASARDDPAVIQAQTRVDGDGTPHPPAPAELEVRARRTLASVIACVLADQSVARHVAEREYTLTLTSATEYPLPHYVGRLVHVRMGDDGEPLTVFALISQYRDWQYRYSVDSTTSANNPRVVYPVERDNDFNLTIGFFPGVTAGDEVKIIYIQRNVAPFRMAMLPDEAHPYVEIQVANRLSGNRYKDDAREALIDMRRALGFPAGTRIKQQYTKDVQWAIARMNADKPVPAGGYTRYFGS
jgi:hypothetical protein